MMGNCWRKFLNCLCLCRRVKSEEREPLLDNDDEDQGSSVDPPTLRRHSLQRSDYGSTVNVLDSTETTPLLASQTVNDEISIDYEQDLTESATAISVAETQSSLSATTLSSDTPEIHDTPSAAATFEPVEGKQNPECAEDISVSQTLKQENNDSLEYESPPSQENDSVKSTSPINVLESSDSAEYSLSSEGSSLLAEHDKKFSPYGDEWEKIILGKSKSVRNKSPNPTAKGKYKRLASEPQLIPENEDEEKEDEIDSDSGVIPTKRQLTAMELLQTETTYIRNLKIIIEIYKQPLEQAVKDGEPILAPEDIKIIFGGIWDILNVHSKMHEGLSGVISEWHEDCCIAELITKYQSQLTKVYPPYVNYFDMGKDVILKQKKVNPKFSEFLINCFNNPTCLKQPLDALLIRPVQRLPSMSLLINDLQRRTPEDIPDHAELEKAKYSLKQVLSHINEDKRKTEGKMKIFDIIYEVESCPVEIVSSNRLFLARVNVTSLNEGLYRAGDRLALYLLTDMIEVSKFKNAPGNILLKHIRMLPLTDIKLVIDVNDSEESDNVFAIQMVEEPSLKSNIQGNAHHNENMDKLCVCQVLDDRKYKDNFLKNLQEQIKATREKGSDEDVLKKMESTEVQPMLKRGGSRVFRRGRTKSKRD